MKKAIFLAAALGVSATASAQFTFGVKAGLNLSSMWGVKEWATNYINFPDPYSPLLGAVAGGQVRCDFGSVRWLALQAEVQFSMQGARSVHYWQWNERQTVGTLRQNYINVPVLFHFKFRRVPMSLFIGEQLGFCVDRYADGQRIKSSVSDGSIYNNGGSAFIFGAQYSLTERLAVDLRLINGSTPCIEIDETTIALQRPNNSPSYVYKSSGGQNIAAQLSAIWTF